MEIERHREAARRAKMTVSAIGIIGLLILLFAIYALEVEGREVLIAITEQRVAHHEVFIKFVVASCDEIRLPGIFALELRHLGVHRSRSYLHPDKLPVEVEVVFK